MTYTGGGGGVGGWQGTNPPWHPGGGAGGGGLHRRDKRRRCADRARAPLRARSRRYEAMHDAFGDNYRRPFRELEGETPVFSGRALQKTANASTSM
jgi:hypothetical protein